MADDYYTTLGVQRNASEAEIHKAYRSLARKFHPDLNPDDKSAKAKFQAVQQAYEVLKDPKKREMYDRYGNSFEAMGGGPTGGRRPGPAGGVDFEEFDFSQIFGDQVGGGGGPAGGFGDFFRQFRSQSGTAGGRQRKQRAARGTDLTHDLEVSFVTSVTGGSVAIGVSRPNGKVDHLDVKIPPGIEDGKKIRLRGQGEPVPGGAPGDLVITIHVQHHPYFQRKGPNLEVRVPVKLSEAVMGAKIDVPTPKGTITMTVPPGTSSGKKLRAKGMGIAKSGEAPGDLMAEIQIMLPAELSDSQKATIQQIDANTPDPRSGLKWQ
jgi:DnaJ-class molecular chaperone